MSPTGRSALSDQRRATLEEEMRLLYVAVTRARTQLTISWALARAPGGRAARRPSRFLDGLLNADERSGSSSRSLRTRKPPAACRVCGRALLAAVARKLGRCEDCPSSYDEDLFQRLREWRAEQARLAAVPAYVVFTDATLTAIAEQRPTDSAALVAIAGIGASKLEKFGSEVLALLAGAAPSGDE